MGFTRERNYFFFQTVKLQTPGREPKATKFEWVGAFFAQELGVGDFFIIAGRGKYIYIYKGRRDKRMLNQLAMSTDRINELPVQIQKGETSFFNFLNFFCGSSSPRTAGKKRGKWGRYWRFFWWRSKHPQTMPLFRKIEGGFLFFQ